MSAVVVIANPTAGRGRAGRLIGKTVAILESLGVEHSVAVSGSAQDMERLAREAAEGGAEIVAALGGDGSVSLVANGLVGTDTALAALPGGTGDDFAKAVLGTGKLDVAARMLAHPNIRPIDIVRVTAGAQVRHYVNIAGAGFDSDVNETANAMTVNLGGTGTYVAAVLKTLKRFVPARYTITVDEERVELAGTLAELVDEREHFDDHYGAHRAARILLGPWYLLGLQGALVDLPIPSAWLAPLLLALLLGLLRHADGRARRLLLVLTGAWVTAWVGFTARILLLAR